MKCPPTQRFVHRWLLGAAFLMLLCFHAVAASADDNWDSQFGAPGADGPIYSIVVSGSDLFVGGNFTRIGGTNATNVAKWNGTNWAALGGGLDGGVFPVTFALAIWNGDLYAGGNFTQADGHPVGGVARWDGQSWRPLSTGVNGTVRALAVSGPKLSIGGSFSLAGGLPVANIAQWDGTNWSALGNGLTWPYPGPAVDSLAADGLDLYAGGRFRTAGGTAATNVAKWNGSDWSPLGHGLRYHNGSDPENGAVRGLIIHNGGLVALGDFFKAGTTDATGIARWNGTNWFSFGSGLSAGRALVANGSNLFVGGEFLTVSGVPAKNIACWDGNLWSALGSGIEGGPEGGAVWSLAANGAAIYAGGPFGLAGGKQSDYAALWYIPHLLSLTRESESLTLSWPGTGTNFLLEAKESIADTNWTVVATHPAVVGDQCRVTNPINSPARFFRLRRK